MMIDDQVPQDNPGAREIGFAIPERYNASRILFDNLVDGRGERMALTGPAGTRSYAELCQEASQWGHGFQSLGLQRGDRILMFLDDTPAYPAAFFGAVRAGFVPLLINTLTPPDLLQFYLSDAGAAVAVSDAEFCARFNTIACKGTPRNSSTRTSGTPWYASAASVGSHCTSASTTSASANPVPAKTPLKMSTMWVASRGHDQRWCAGVTNASPSR